MISDRLKEYVVIQYREVAWAGRRGGSCSFEGDLVVGVVCFIYVG